jgi:hypothetical protein
MAEVEGSISVVVSLSTEVVFEEVSLLMLLSLAYMSLLHTK